VKRLSGARIEKEVAGEFNTFQVYLLMLKVKKASGREVAEQLGFSSPSLAVHHLEKLSGLRLVKKDQFGVYHVISRRFGILRFFFVVRQFIVPRTFFYALLYAVMVVFSVFLLSDVARMVALFFSLFGAVISVVETIEFYKLIPKTKPVQEVEQPVQKND
jgi:hypothetical protein